MPKGILYIVPTPIGNLQDMSFRAIEVLKQVDLILAEDTRTSKTLLNYFEIITPLRAYHLFNEHQTTAQFLNLLASGKNLAIISDAGTPAISDPGFLIVRACVEAQIEICSLPGPTAFVPALVASGLPCDRFVFEGFLPPKKGRHTRLEFLKEDTRTLVFYESPHRLLKTLTQFISCFGGERKASISRELTKVYEETLRGSLNVLANHFTENTPKGEFVIVVEGATKS